MERAEVGELRERGDVPRGAREVDDDEVRVRGALREEVLVRGGGGEYGEEDVAVGEEGEGGELGRVDMLCGRVSGAGAGAGRVRTRRSPPVFRFQMSSSATMSSSDGCVRIPTRSSEVCIA